MNTPLFRGVATVLFSLNSEFLLCDLLSPLLRVVKFVSLWRLHCCSFGSTLRLSLLSCGFFFFSTALAFSFSFPLLSAGPDESWLSRFFVNLFRTLPAALSIEPVSDSRLSLEVLLGGPGMSCLLFGLWSAPLDSSCLFSFTGTKDPLCSSRDGGGLVAVADWTLATDTSLTLRSGGAYPQLVLVQHCI